MTGRQKESAGIKLILLLSLATFLPAGPGQAFELTNAECIAPAKPEGGHDIMCRLLANSLAESLLIPMSIRFMPGGIGALSYNYAINVRSKDANMVVAASTGSLLNLALRKYGKYTEADVRWLGAVGSDYGVVVVRDDAPWRNLGELVAAIRAKPGKYDFLPTAIEQGYDVVWPLWRGYYLPPRISGDEYLWWVNTLYRLEASEAFTREREKLRLFLLAMALGAVRW